MTEAVHPNLSLLAELDLQNLDACRHVISDDFIWHYFNPELPELEGEHQGVDGLKGFFAKLDERSEGSFQVNVVDARPAGEELVVTQVCNRIVLDSHELEFDAVVIWRVVNSKLAEGWDIPAVNTIRTIEKSSRLPGL